MRQFAAVLALVAASLVLAGCIGPNPYRSVDLGRDLAPADLERYESEWKALQAKGATGHMARLEGSNWWPLGLLLYHRDASVMRMQTPDGPIYHISSGQGLAPLGLLYAVSTHATYTAKGERINWMRMHNMLVGHLAMGHETEAKLADGRVESSSSWHVIHHAFSYHRMDGHTYYSLFTVPNPIGVTVAGDSCHE